MLQLFRKYQKYLYILITIVIVTSFSFFGTYGTLSNGSFREQIAFKSIDGSDVTRYELDEMVQFLTTDTEDKVLLGGVWGPNFLNDGVIKKNFIETGLGYILAESYKEQIAQDFEARHEKEQRFGLYTHPQAQFISVEGAWKYFSPTMKENYEAVRNAKDPMSPQALRARMALFLMEKQFPQSLLRQVLRYQESQHPYIKADPNLNYLDLSLFGYHTAEDWFGPRFTRIIAEFIINSSIIAEQRGYQVSRTEALADLKRNAEMSFQQNKKSANLGVRDSHEYFQEQLRRLGMDQNMAAKVWQKVLLFRRLFQDLGSSMFVDPAAFHGFNTHALESLEGTTYRMPKELQINTFRSLQKFETYLDAIAKRSDEERLKLAMPTTFLTTAEVAKKNPGLVEKKYVLEVAEIDKTALEANVSLKSTWAWETSNEGWEKIQKQFSDLKFDATANSNQRFAALEALDEKTRQRIDAYARSAIVDTHPEWIVDSLFNTEKTQQTVGLAEGKGKTPFKGVSSTKDLMDLLDTASLKGKEPKTDVEKKAITLLHQFTGNNNTYYSIDVVERAPRAEVLTFAQANDKGILDQLLDKQLEEHYLKIRETTPADFQTSNGTWKPFTDVKDAVAEKYFDKTLKGLRAAYATAIAPEKPPEKLINDLAASYRFYPYVQDVQKKLSKDPGLKDTLTTNAQPSSDSLKASGTLPDQWKLVRSETKATKSSGDTTVGTEALFKLGPNSFSAIDTPANGDISFLFVKTRGNDTTDLTKSASAQQARRLLSEGAEYKLMQQLVTEMKEKKAISLDYLNQLPSNEMGEGEFGPTGTAG